MRSRKGWPSGRCSGTRRGGRKDSSVWVGFVVLLLLASSILLNGTGTARATAVTGPTIASLGDNEQVSTIVGGITYILNDTIVTGTLTASLRSYEVVLRANLSLPKDYVNVSTAPT